MLLADLVQRGALFWGAYFHPKPERQLRGWRSSSCDSPRRVDKAQLSPPPWRAVLWDPCRGSSWNFYTNVHPRKLVWWDLLVCILCLPTILGYISFKYFIFCQIYTLSSQIIHLNLRYYIMFNIYLALGNRDLNILVGIVFNLEP